jgi:hypothetical protein
METNDCKSTQELLNEAYRLACSLAYKTILEDGHYFDVREDFPLGGDVDKIFCYVDGLEHKYAENITTGRCSLQAAMDFDVFEYEKRIESDIEEFKRLILIYGEPRVLSKDELKKRGYRGEMAGYTKEEDRDYYIAEWEKDLVKYRAEFKSAKGYDQRYYAENNINHCEKRLKELKDETLL